MSTIQPFYDYDELLERALKYEGPPIDPQAFSHHIAGLGALGKQKGLPILEGICALIIHHAIKNGKIVKSDKPAYGGSICQGGHGVIFNLSPGFDPTLQLIIHIYLQSISKK